MPAVLRFPLLPLNRSARAFSPGHVPALALCAAVGGLVGVLIVPAPAEKLPVAGPPPRVVLDGQELTMGDHARTLDQARSITRAYLARPLKIRVPGGGERERSPQELGARLSPARLASLVAEAHHPESALRRLHDQRHRGAPLVLPMPIEVDDTRGLAEMIELKDDLDATPSDAHLDVASKRIVPERAGRRIDAYATWSRLATSLLRGDGTVLAVAETAPAARTTRDLENVSWDDVLGYFETRYAPDRKHEARTFNLRLAASKLDGHVIMPGDTFDLNEVVGPRSEANGYRPAPVIAEGELVDGIGGGTCQIAGTLHGAAFFAGLDIVERRPHTRPSFYIKMGLDAAVAYPTATLKVRNPFSFPVVLHETVQDGFVRAQILGPKRTRDVSFVRKIHEVIAFQEKEVADPNIPRGKRELSQRGIPGFKIARYRIVRDGAFAVRERSSDMYPPTTQIWRVGTGEANPRWTPHDDEHPEYVADEYLSISQGPNVSSPRAVLADKGGAMLESRVAGRYGTHGWTVREGFAKRVKGESTAGGDESGPGVD